MFVQEAQCQEYHSHLLLGQSSSPIRDFFTVLALSFHSVFEGLAVGLEEVSSINCQCNWCSLMHHVRWQFVLLRFTNIYFFQHYLFKSGDWSRVVDVCCNCHPQVCHRLLCQSRVAAGKIFSPLRALLAATFLPGRGQFTRLWSLLSHIFSHDVSAIIRVNWLCSMI